ncbi:endonuclease [Micromonospora sp. BRA006-A]|nr:endonuclease [Micromonospora sp. BRA006-A]
MQTKLSYDQVWDALKDTDQDPANPANVILLYSGRSQSKTSNGGGANDWNREHVWAKSHGDFGTATGPGTDVHHLRPEDVSVNSSRGNKDFDSGGGTVAEAPGCYTDADSFEPRDAVKGDVARMILYMAIRYEGDDGWPDLEPNDSVSNGSAPRLGRLSKLLAWNDQDPPDAFEKRRNQRIHERWQGNRNSFVDHPEWARSIWG